MGAKKLSGSDKAAVLLLALGEELAGPLLAGLPAEEARRVAGALGRLGRVAPETADEVLAEFRALLAKGPGRGVDAQSATARKILEAAGLDVVDGSAPLRETAAALDEKTLAAYLRKEHPQTMAVVLAHLEGKKSGAVLKLLPESLHVELITRIAALDTVDPEVLAALEEALRAEAGRARQRRERPLGGPDPVAQMIAAMDKEAAERYLTELEARDPALAEAVRERLFRFVDLVRIEDAGLRTLLAATPRATLLLALKSAPEAVSAALYRNMSERAAKLLREDLEALGKKRLDEVEAAQREIAQLARKLEAEGKLVIRGAGETLV